MDRGSLKERYGPWALITGASAGIGLAFARHLSAEGFDIVIVARRERALAECKTALEQEFGNRVRTIAADLSTEVDVDRVIHETEDLEIGLLINNAGAYTVGAVLGSKAEEAEATARLNVIAPLRLTLSFGAAMKTRKRGGIVFVACNSGYQAVPYLGVYSASKAFMLMLGESMYAETTGTGVDVLVMSPGPTRTPGMNSLSGIDFKKIPMAFMSPESVVISGLCKLGKTPSTVIGFKNWLMIFICQRLLSRRTLLAFTRWTMYKAVDPDRR